MSGAGNPDISTLPIMPPSADDTPWGSFNTYSSPGGGGGYVDETSSLNSSQPAGASNAQLAKALQSLSSANKAAQSSAADKQPTFAPTPQNAPIGHPNRPTSISALIDFLQNQREGYLNSAMGAPGTARPVTMPLHTGLLGF